jgi:purine-binding chemotaxis protein CheW
MNCILLDLQGLKLAVPLERVEGALQLESLTLTLEGPDWILGRFGEEPARTWLVDTGKWLIPERYKPENSNYAEVIILQGRRWAIACDELIKSVRIDTAQINWHRDKRHRPWLLGTYMPERCAILDIDQLLPEFEATIA